MRGGATRAPSPAVRAEGHRARARRVLLRGAGGAERRAVFLRRIHRESLRGRAARARAAARRGAVVVRREPASRGAVRFVGVGGDAKPSSVSPAVLATARAHARARRARGAGGVTPGGTEPGGTVARSGGLRRRYPVTSRVRRRDSASAGAGRVRGRAAREGSPTRTSAERPTRGRLLRSARAARRSSGGSVFLRAERARRDARVPGELPRDVRLRGGAGDVRRRRARGKRVRALSASGVGRYRRCLLPFELDRELDRELAHEPHDLASVPAVPRGAAGAAAPAGPASGDRRSPGRIRRYECAGAERRARRPARVPLRVAGCAPGEPVRRVVGSGSVVVG